MHYSLCNVVKFTQSTDARLPQGQQNECGLHIFRFSTQWFHLQILNSQALKSQVPSIDALNLMCQGQVPPFLSNINSLRRYAIQISSSNCSVGLFQIDTSAWHFYSLELLKVYSLELFKSTTTFTTTKILQTEKTYAKEICEIGDRWG